MVAQRKLWYLSTRDEEESGGSYNYNLASVVIMPIKVKMLQRNNLMSELTVTTIGAKGFASSDRSIGTDG